MNWHAYRRSTCAGAACTLVALVAWAYWPGLQGPFLFDDFVNLDQLGAFGPMDDWRSFLLYLTSGTADPTGRPVALLTFLIDGQEWPTDPWPFKRTNLVLHLLNSVLLGVVVHRLQEALARRSPGIAISAWTPMLAATLWAAHPFLVSTTLYVVQREAMLPVAFVLLVLLAWDRAVLEFQSMRTGRGWAWATLGVGVFTLLAGLSKANGFLAPLLAGIAYLCILRRPLADGTHRSADLAAVICLGIPSLLLFSYLVQLGIKLWPLPPLAGRDWTIPERLMTQPRALWDYVWHLALPRAGGGGLFVEGFPVSRSWGDPPSTLPAALCLLGSTATAILLRERYPIAAFAWLFFLGAHLLESSVVALEPYFEHRNYLPAAFLGWPVAHFLLAPGRYPRYRAAFAAALVAILLLLTHQRAVVWGNPALLNALSATHEQESLRAQVASAQQALQSGNVERGLDAIRTLQRRHPASADVALNAVGMECLATASTLPETRTRAIEALRTSRRWTFAMNTWLQDAARAPAIQHCEGMGVEGVEGLAIAAASNPVNQPPHRLRELWHVRGRIELARGRPQEGLRWFNAALELLPDPDYALVQAGALGDAGAQGLGIAHLDHYSRISRQAPLEIRDIHGVHRWLLRHYDYYGTEIATLRDRLRADMASATGKLPVDRSRPAPDRGD